MRSSSQAVLDVEDASCTALAGGISMVAPAVEGIDLLKLDVLEIELRKDRFPIEII